MPQQIKYKETKAERKAERQKLGRLEDQRVSPGTTARYQRSLDELCEFAHASADHLLRRVDLGDVLSAYVEKLWEDGDTKTMASYTLAAVQFFRPQVKGQLTKAWKLLALWGKLEQPRRATPLDAPLCLAFAGKFLQWQWHELACITIVGFCGLLRTAEMFQLKRSQVVLPRRANQAAILFLFNTKTTKRNLLEAEKVMITEQVGIDALRYLCNQVRKDEPLVSVSPAKFRTLWKEVVNEFLLTQFHYLPYSLRRGGATCAYREGMSFDQLMAKGRWRNLATARGYLDLALQEYATISLPPQSLPKIRAAQSAFKAAGLGRVEEEARGGSF
jgi:hypothetical protein